jgi:hypothetical protein
MHGPRVLAKEALAGAAEERPGARRAAERQSARCASAAAAVHGQHTRKAACALSALVRESCARTISSSAAVLVASALLCPCSRRAGLFSAVCEQTSVIGAEGGVCLDAAGAPARAAAAQGARTRAPPVTFRRGAAPPEAAGALSAEARCRRRRRSTASFGHDRHLPLAHRTRALLRRPSVAPSPPPLRTRLPA